MSSGRISILFLMVILVLPGISSGKDPGTVGGQVLKLGAHCRSAGMGGAFTAVSDDVSALYYNPAGLAQLVRPEAAFTYMSHIAGAKSFDTAFALPLGERGGALGAALYYLYTRDKRVDGDTGIETGNFTCYNSYLILGYSRKVGDYFSAGINSKFMMNRLDDFRSSNSGLDLGALYNPSGRFRLGAGVRNIGTDIKLRKGDSLETWPLTLTAGASFRFINPDITLASDIRKESDSGMIYSMGAEYTLETEYGLVSVLEYSPVFVFRTGYSRIPERSSPGGAAGLGAGF